MSKKNAKSGGTATATAKPKDTSPRVHQRDKIVYDLNIRQRDDLTDKQKQFIDLVLDKETKIVFVSGPAGTSKTFLSVLAGLMVMNKHAVSHVLYIRSVIESASKSLGFLPGEAGDKMEPYLRPLMDKLEELLPKEQIDLLQKEERIIGAPVNFLRGASLNATYIIADEAQNFTRKELVTIMTRLGKFSKLIIAGDPGQSDIGSTSGFAGLADLFNDEESKGHGIHYFAFTRDDIVRSGVLKYIVERLERPPGHTEPMFPAPVK